MTQTMIAYICKSLLRRKKKFEKFLIILAYTATFHVQCKVASSIYCRQLSKQTLVVLYGKKIVHK